MDLGEIRKKAKSRKPNKEETVKEPGKTARKRTPKKEEPSVPSGDATPVESVDLSGETEVPEENASHGNTMNSGEKKAAVKVDTPASIEEVLISQRKEVKEEEVELLQLLTFQLGGEEYALNIMDIKEIIRPVEPTEVPKTPEYILGIFSLRGTIIPVFDVSLRLGLPPGERGPQNRVVVVKSRENFFGLHVDSVIQVLDIPLDKIEPPPEILGGVEGEFLRGIGRIDDRLIILLNLEKVLRLEENDSGHLELPHGKTN